MTLRSTIGADSGRGFGLYSTAPSGAYIEDVFSTYLYTGNGSTQTITNGIDLSGKGGLVWAKARSFGWDHVLVDTVRGAGNWLKSNLTDASAFASNIIGGFSTTGFSVSASANVSSNDNNITYASWTFRKQPKFFDVVTYVGTGSTQTISHNLGSPPGMIIVKSTTNVNGWLVYHKSLGINQYVLLNATSAAGTLSGYWGSSNPTSTTFGVGGPGFVNNLSGETYVAYLFADNAGGFGADGSQNVISCGSFTTDASGNASINLGYEPQYILVKQVTGPAESWYQFDTMRSNSYSSTSILYPDLANGENNIAGGYLNFTANGVNFVNNLLTASKTYIYMAIRRGPMKTPTDATKVYTTYYSGAATSPSFTSNFVVDFSILKNTAGSSTYAHSRLLGTGYQSWNSTAIEATNASSTWGYMNGFWTGGAGLTQYIASMFKRAPSFMDVVCYTGTGVSRSVNHNLGVAPELIVLKRRNAANVWVSYSATLGASNVLVPNTTAASAAGTEWASTSPTSSVFTVGTAATVNASGGTYVAYLFASCPGVSKVGSYTGTGGTQTINCGFAGGARYVLIKRTDSTGSWWSWNSTRGMVAGTDPRMAYETTAAETNANWVYTTTGGFQIVTSDATVNELPGITWVARTSGFGSSDIFGSASSSTLSVIVGAAGKIFTSSDGITWTSRTSGTSSVFYGATYGNGLFVAVGAGGIIFTSPDGITWTSRTSGISTDLYCVGYANGLFVTGGVNGVLLTSPDGITWTSRTSSIGGGDYIVSFAYGNGTYIIGASAGKLSTSTDGITWTSRTTGFGGSGVFAATFGNNTFVIGGEAGKAATSTDGITWTLRTSGFSASYAIYGANYANGVFILGGGNGQLSTSTDGITWTARTSGFSTTEIRTVSSLGTTNIIAGRSALLSTNAPSYIYLAIA